MPGSPDQLGLTLIKFDAYKNPENFLKKGVRHYLMIILAKVALDNWSALFYAIVSRHSIFPGKIKARPRASVSNKLS